MKTILNAKGTLMNRSNITRLLALAAFAAVVGVSQTGQATVVGSKHDLSTATGDSTQPCAFCHTPHGANANVNAPLWNRFVNPATVFQLYTSPTMNSTFLDGAGSVGGVSAVCLGCHDGTQATAVVSGVIGSTKHDLVNAPGPGGTPDTTSQPNCSRCHPDMYGGPAVNWMGTDLRNDHPIRISYPTAAQDPDFVPIATVQASTGVQLYGTLQDTVECASCHNPHGGIAGTPFLRRDNIASGLCLECHVK